MRTKDEMERMRTCLDKQYMYIKAAWLQLYKCMHMHTCVHDVCMGRLHVHVHCMNVWVGRTPPICCLHKCMWCEYLSMLVVVLCM